MIILTFILLVAGLVTFLLTNFLSLSLWFLPFWIFAGLISGVVVFLITFIGGSFLAERREITSRGNHFYARMISDFALLMLKIKIVTVVGKENLPLNNFVLYSNHRSNTDPFIIISALRRPLGFAAKSAIFKIPFVKTWLAAIGSININRESDRESIKEIIKGIKNVEKGASLAIFPEGGILSWSNPYLMNIKPGAFRLATKPQVPIVPIAIIGSMQVKFNLPWRRTKVKIIVGKPIEYDEYQNLTSVEIGELVFEKINNLIKVHL